MLDGGGGMNEGWCLIIFNYFIFFCGLFREGRNLLFDLIVLFFFVKKV